MNGNREHKFVLFNKKSFFFIMIQLFLYTHTLTLSFSFVIVVVFREKNDFFTLFSSICDVLLISFVN